MFIYIGKDDIGKKYKCTCGEEYYIEDIKAFKCPLCHYNLIKINKNIAYKINSDFNDVINNIKGLIDG